MSKPFNPMVLERFQDDLHQAQFNIRKALDDAATYPNHPGLVIALLDELSQPHMRAAFIKQCQDIVEGHETVSRDFVRAVQRVAIEFFGEPS